MRKAKFFTSYLSTDGLELPVNLSENLQLRKVRDADMNDLPIIKTDRGSFSPALLYGDEYVFEYSNCDIDNTVVFDVANFLEFTLNVLAKRKSGSPQFFKFVITDYGDGKCVFERCSITSDFPTSPIHSQFGINGSNLNEVKDRIHQLLENKDRDEIKTAISRYVDIFKMRQGLDSLLDYIIGIESITGDSESPISYKVSMRTACLIGNNIDDRKKIRERLKNAYDIRSKIAHGANSAHPCLKKCAEKEGVSEIDWIFSIKQILGELILSALAVTNTISSADDKLLGCVVSSCS